jgi:aminopeptidase N
LLRADLLASLGELGDPQVAAEAKKRFDKFLTDPSSLAINLRPVVADIVGRNADRQTWDHLHELGRTTTNIGEKGNYYYALTLAPEFAGQALALSLGNELPASAALRLVTEVAHDGHQAEAAWKFLSAHQAQLDAKLDSLGRVKFVPSVARAFSSEARAAELEAYAREHLPAGAKSEVAKAAEGIRFKADLKARLFPELAKWIAAHPATPAP